jgi:hypothetical protein
MGCFEENILFFHNKIMAYQANCPKSLEKSLNKTNTNIRAQVEQQAKEVSAK